MTAKDYLKKLDQLTKKLEKIQRDKETLKYDYAKSFLDLVRGDKVEVEWDSGKKKIGYVQDFYIDDKGKAYPIVAPHKINSRIKLQAYEGYTKWVKV